MRKSFILIVCFCIYSIRLMSQIQIHSDFPGGNLLIDKIKNDTVWVRPDLRDTEGNWFYWYFGVSNAAEKTLTFVFPPNCFTRAGVSVSSDEGINWKWEQPEAFLNDNFTYHFRSNDEVRFCMAIPYTQLNWERFLMKYKNDPYLRLSYLVKTKKNRNVEMALIRNPHKASKAKVLLTARHHACEMIADYVMEGLFEYVMQDSWLKENFEFMFLPFMDKDGVEDGDQGKNRKPRDHNRDYSQISVHETTAAVRDYIPVWSEHKLKIVMDMHCPWIHSGQNDSIFFVGAENKCLEAKQLHFSDLVKKNNRGELVYDPDSFCKYGSKPWTIPSFPDPGMKFSTWASYLEGNDLSISLETPYGIHGNQLITADNARLFGHDVAAAIKDYLKGLEL
ncbi:M14 family zinc carboxypeptidase [uncultured Parabacteroides sp.]|uniref:M14 family zinc carboxypeptidase n=1 Tax=uncultured Parabacteroides sp. TaxID=512312 RepID=UPI0025F95F24|nr:M14 family zinc carboxypeptidase [uncultured Parabacteroides sp.]